MTTPQQQTLTFRERLARCAEQLRTNGGDPEAAAWAEMIDGLLAGDGAEQMEADMIEMGLDGLDEDERLFLEVLIA